MSDQRKKEMTINGKEYNDAHIIIEGDTVKIQFLDKELMDEIISLFKFGIEHKGQHRTVYVHNINENEIILKKW